MTLDGTADGYERLAKLVERELRLLEDGRLGELAVAIRETGALIASLPSAPPPAARAAVARAMAVRERVRIELERRQMIINQSRAVLSTARRVQKTYLRPPDRRYSITA